jgi:hypothetical protein
LTPPSFFEEQERIKKRRQEERRAERIKKRQGEWRIDHSEVVRNEREKLENSASNVGKSRKEYKERQRANAQLKRMMATEPPPFVDEPLESSDEEVSMFFQEPQQMLDIFSSLEQENFDLMQEEGAAKQALESVKKSCQIAIENTNKESEVLQASVDSLQRQAKVEEAAGVQHQNADLAVSGKEKMAGDQALLELQSKVQDVYYATGFQDVGAAAPSTLYMLSELEGQMESIISAISQLPEEYVKSEEKKKEKKRREDRRLQKQREMDEAREARNKKALERSNEPPKKKSGRPVSLFFPLMFSPIGLI